MHPVLISFHFPEWLGRFSVVEAGATAVFVVLLYAWQSRRAGFEVRNFAFWTGSYAVMRALIYFGGPGYHFKLHTYGVMIAIGFVVGIYLAARQARREGVSADIILDLAFWVLISSLIGSRVLFIIVNIQDYMADPMLFFKFWQGGLVFQGGLIGALLAAWYYCHRFGVDFFRLGDITIPSVAIGHALGRLGCYSAGCCHGIPTNSPSFGAVFSHPGTVVARNHLLGVPIHPTQLYESVGELAIFLVLIWMRPRKRFKGQLMIAYLLFYALLRSFTEIFRGDTERGLLLQIDLFGDPAPELLSTGQLISLILAAAAVILWVTLTRKSDREARAPGADPQVGTK